MKLKALLGELPYILIQGSVDRLIQGIAYDSRTVTTDTLFVCIKGFQSDGHHYIKNAIKLGATSFLVEDEVDDITEEITVVKVTDARRALAYVAAHYYELPSTKLSLIGITGTKGKTTVSYYIKKILEGLGYRTGIIGSRGSFLEGTAIATTKNTVTTPNSLELQNILWQMVEAKAEYAVLEVTSHALALHRVEECEFLLGVFTNLYEDHLEFHGSMEAYQKAKLKLFEQCKSAVINVDSELAPEIFKRCENCITYGIVQKADIMATDITCEVGKLRCQVICQEYSAYIELSVNNEYEIYNVLAAIATGYSIGMEFDKIISVFKI